jgi:hypothetical protein
VSVLFRRAADNRPERPLDQRSDFLIIDSIDRIPAWVAPTLNEKYMCTGSVARISPTSLPATVSTSPISRSL